MKNEDKIILHLCASKYGSDSKPYRDAGYDVRLITEDIDVRTYTPPKNVYGIIANSPCTMFSIARTTGKTPRDLRHGMELVQACLKIIWECQYDLPSHNSRTIGLKFWAIENPGTGLLRHFLGKPAFEYSPDEYGADFTKRTALWGHFNAPARPFMLRPKLIKRDPSSHMFAATRKETTDLRSIAYEGFTKAFYQANQ